MPKTTTITKSLHFDAGHRLPDHGSKCQHLHGHRYTIELTLEGPVQTSHGTQQEGMVTDFSQIKELAWTHLIQAWDHAFLVANTDTHVKDFLNSLENHKTVVLPCVPTVENLAHLALDKLDTVVKDNTSVRLRHVRLYETPTSWADVSSSTGDSKY